MSIVDRVQAILLKPRETWPAIAAEPADTASIYTNYVMILAAIPAVASFIGLSLIGFGGVGDAYRLPVMTGLVFMVAHYLTTLLMVFVLALVVDALAPLFGGTKNPVQALKLVAYGSTASFVGGIFGAIQSLSFLGLLASLYSIWLIYTGVAPLMRSPVGKSVAYTVVIVIAAIVARVLIGALTGLLSWFPGFGSQSAADAAAAWARVAGA